MSKREKTSISLDSFNTPNDIIIDETLEVKPKKTIQPKISKSVVSESNNKSKSKLNKIQKANLTNPKIKEGTSKKENYAITFKIDADIEDYLKNIMWVQYNNGVLWITEDNGTRKNLNKNYYINDLIRKDMIKNLGLKPNATASEIQTAWLEYKNKYNLK